MESSTVLYNTTSETSLVTYDPENTDQVAMFLRENYTLIEEDKVKMIEQGEEVQIAPQNLGFWGSILRYGWKPTTTDLLRDTEAFILKTLKHLLNSILWILVVIISIL